MEATNAIVDEKSRDIAKVGLKRAGLGQGLIMFWSTGWLHRMVRFVASSRGSNKIFASERMN